MVFNSLNYLFFFVFVFFINNLLNEKYRLYFLLAASYIFYGFLHPVCPIVLFSVTVSGYFLSHSMVNSDNDRRKKYLLIFTIIINLFLIIFFRCSRDIICFFSAGKITVQEIPVIPFIGISFYVFQNLSYVIDCYLETYEPEKNFFKFALYLAFFPKLLQGPIERAKNLIPQLHGSFSPSYQYFRHGALLFAIGLFKKVVIADNMSFIVAKILSGLDSRTNLAVLLLPYFYAVEIYFDFSGYTDMALGSARIFGIKLTNNFNFPYLARSVQDFWKRWNITLSSGLLDYVFKPLQMEFRNFGNFGISAGLIITFFVCGIWHGITLNYIIWGLIHGVFMSLFLLFHKKWDKLFKNIKINKKVLHIFETVLTFNLICFTWIFFMTEDFKNIFYILKTNLNTIVHPLTLSLRNNNFGGPKGYFIVLMAVIIIDIIQHKKDLFTKVLEAKPAVRWAFYYLLVFIIAYIGAFGESKFIYFKF